jgi:hypothetical protein
MAHTQTYGMTSTSSTPKPRSRIGNSLVIVLIFIITPIAVYLAATNLLGPPRLSGPALPEIPPPGAAESVTVPFANSTAIAAATSYSGPLRLVIEGFGNLENGTFADAFYRYAAADGFSLDEPELRAMRILVNGEDRTGEIELPRYNPFHLYEINLDLGADAQSIAFLIEEGDPSDSEGRLVVYIVPEPDA